MENQVKLEKVSLCAIVRDEIMNPAGGIRDFVESTIPYVEKAVIVDTGSLDSTREYLEEAQEKYENLRVFDHKWNGFSDARNFAQEQVETEYALVLDADERFTRDDFIILKEVMEIEPTNGYYFEFLTIYPEIETEIIVGGLNPRLFRANIGLKFFNRVYESTLLVKDNRRKILTEDWNHLTPLYIKHFLASVDANYKKTKKWYESGYHYAVSPSETPGFEEWKEFNPRRDEFR